METSHIDVGAVGRTRLVETDEDRRDLVDQLAGALGALLLAFCVMDTHVHLVAEGPVEHVRRWLDQALGAYARAFARRHGREAGPLLREEPVMIPKTSDFELARTVDYDHRNPVECRTPLVARPLDWPWSSARAFAGLALDPRVNVPRARELLGPHARWAAGWQPPLADLEPAPLPSVKVEDVLAAAAEAHDLLPGSLAGNGRGPVLNRARAAFLRLGKLEGFTYTQLAAQLARTQAWASMLAQACPACDEHVRACRTLLRERGRGRDLLARQIYEKHKSEARLAANPR